MAESKTPAASKTTKTAASKGTSAKTAAAKPAVVKPAVAKTAAVKPAAKAAAKPAVKSAAKTAAGKTTARRAKAKAVSPEQRYMMIAEAAYFRAEKRGFTGTDAWHDWYEAEREIDGMLASGKLPF